MTKEQKLEACSMRFDGYSLQAIADHFGTTKEYIRQITPKMNARGCSRATLRTYIYPNISRWMQNSYVNALKLSKMTGLTGTTIKNALTGKNITKNVIDKILEVTGLTYEEAFYIASENSNQPLHEEPT